MAELVINKLIDSFADELGLNYYYYYYQGNFEICNACNVI